MRRDVHLVGYADDVGIIIVEKDLDKMRELAETTNRELGCWYESEGLKLAHHKTEAILLTGRKVPRGLQISCGNATITSATMVKYLGVLLERNSQFKAHIQTACSKALKYANALALLTPNVGGAGNFVRKLYYKVVESVILYAAPIWAPGVHNKKNLSVLVGTQRTALLRVAQACRTTSYDALCVITGQIPIDLLIWERKYVFENRSTTSTGPVTDSDIGALKKSGKGGGIYPPKVGGLIGLFRS